MSSVATRLLKIGHRGAPRLAPANTMASFQAAVARGCDWIECDCRASKDGVIVLAHDPEVFEPETERIVHVHQATASELARLDLGKGEGVPTLEELVDWAVRHGQVGIMADVKDGGWEKEIGALLEPLPADRKLVPGADMGGRQRFRMLYPGLPLSLTVNRMGLAALRGHLKTLDTEAVTFEYPLVTSQRVNLLHSQGIRVFAWTVDDLTAMQALMAMGVDGLISNRADLLAEL